VNALFWGFFVAGILKTSLSRSDIKDDPQVLETNTYQGTSLDALHKAYPDRDMTADLEVLVEPTVSFTTIYQLTEDNLAKVQQDVGAYGQDIADLGPGTYSSQDGLEQALRSYQDGLIDYAAKIEQDIAVPGVVVNHMVRCVLNVEARGKNPAVPAILTFDVAQTFVMQDLKLGVSSTGTTQSVIFTFIQPMDSNPQPIFVSSTLSGVNEAHLADMWEGLRHNWQNAFTAIGRAGLPLPRIPGFDFLFATLYALTAISWAGGYVTATTAAAHGVQVGQAFEISGVTPSSYNGVFTALTGTTGNALVYALDTNPGAATVLGIVDTIASTLIKLNPPVAGASGYISITTNFTYSPEKLAPAVREMLAKQKTLRVA